jgi:K+-sensing histidine kinase KdpD
MCYSSPSAALAVNRMTETKQNTNLVGAVAICFVAVFLTTSVLWTIDYLRPTRHLLLGYLLVTIFIAICFGGILALVTAFACGLTAAYFLLPPQLSFYVEDPAQITELMFTILLAVLAATGVVGLTRGRTEHSSWEWPP